ncbi:isoprenylcysteine carboxylmethyltransferase family protein [Paracoccus sp. TK19116]|uniref:Isoprenylcysteine carboxylmethyltransferase family protein n=1 Tax=Paracoccus albicereus TaxID=2922394 RepID=A0ABT1MV11_9RHOB|nr:isoprenylcysteine carboxylmethyltransferase family protein [Paracoccus albicereus]MCQ0972157.1 isoprenylcysteine carboxylmethyltransferase family protein [Paracoccus albicereus]
MVEAVNQQTRIAILRLGFLAMLPVLILIKPHMAFDSLGHEIIEAAGALILIAGVLGRFWSILYVGGQKNARLTVDGPYSVTRNPLYVASTVAAFGIGLMMGAFGFALLVGGAVGLVLYITALREARYLEAEFGAEYRAYAARVPFFIPNPSLFYTPPEAVFRTGPLRRNLFDAMVFLSFIPLVEFLDLFKTSFGLSGWSLW